MPHHLPSNPARSSSQAVRVCPTYSVITQQPTTPTVPAAGSPLPALRSAPTAATLHTTWAPGTLPKHHSQTELCRTRSSFCTKKDTTSAASSNRLDSSTRHCTAHCRSHIKLSCRCIRQLCSVPLQQHSSAPPHPEASVHTDPSAAAAANSPTHTQDLQEQHWHSN